MTSYCDQFAEDEGYLDFARVGPVSRPVVDAAAGALTAQSAAGRTTVDELMAAEDRALSAAARVTGFPRRSLVWSPSTSAGLFQAAFAVVGRVLVSAAEFPANLYPWWRAAEAGQLDVGLLPGGPVTPDAVRAALRERDADVVAVSAVDFATGYRADLPALREVVGDRLLVVDAIQGLGVVEEDWTAADVLVFGGQKWLRSGWSTGAMAVADRALDRLHPLLAGWTGVDGPTRYDGEEHPRTGGAAQFTMTNGSPVAQAALAAGLELLEQAGPGWVAGRVRECAGELVELLDRCGAEVTSERDPAHRAGIVAARVPEVPGDVLHAALGEAGVACTRHGERVRLSVHATTRTEAFDRVGDALTRLTGRR